MFLPNLHSFLLVNPHTKKFDVRVESTILKPIIQSGIQESATSFSSPSSPSDSGRRMFLSNKQSFLLEQRIVVTPDFQPDIGNVTDAIFQSTDGEQSKVNDQSKRTFLKVAGIASAGIVGSLILPNKASALIMGSSPTTGVVGAKNASNVRINPATEETLNEVLKTTDLTFDAGSLQVKVTGAGATSFSDSGNVARSGLVDVDRHVQVDVLSSALPSSASTETTLQTISFGGFKFALRLDTAGDIDYVGEASTGTATSGALWRIKRVDSTTGTVIQWADGNSNFDNVWDNRASLSYS